MTQRSERDIIEVIFIPPDHWWKRAKWKLMHDYTSDNGDVVVPAGFITDGASIPLTLRWRFPLTGTYFGAAIVHDYILISSGDWKRANKEFEQEMEALGVSKFDRIVLVSAVKIWAWFVTKILKRGPKQIQ